MRAMMLNKVKYTKRLNARQLSVMHTENKVNSPYPPEWIECWFRAGSTCKPFKNQFAFPWARADITFHIRPCLHLWFRSITYMTLIYRLSVMGEAIVVFFGGWCLGDFYLTHIMVCLPGFKVLSTTCPLSTDNSFPSTIAENTGVLQATSFKPSPIMVKGESQK